MAELFDAVEDQLEASLELARGVVPRCPELLDHFDEMRNRVARDGSAELRSWRRASAVAAMSLANVASCRAKP